MPASLIIVAITDVATAKFAKMPKNIQQMQARLVNPQSTNNDGTILQLLEWISWG